MSRRFTYWSLSAFGALVLLVLAGAVGAAVLGGAAGAAGQPAAPAAAGNGAASYHVTLITGDVVQVNVSPDGLQAATVKAASRGQGLPESSFHIVRNGDDLYVFPTDVAQYIGSKLDKELFNVSKLHEQGLQDGATDSLPVIVVYRRTVGAAPPAMVKKRTLESITAAAAVEPKSKAAAFGRAVAEQARRDAGTGKAIDTAAPAGSDPFAGIERIWLDERVEATLEDSVPQIGAPTAWAAGFDGTGVRVAVLDTGVDATHPDLAGKVVAMKNFTSAADVTDHFGHGTHVASIIAGTGAASSGLRKGVAPGATILNGKVLDDSGTGQWSWIIAGMEWAARDEGVEVVNMSLAGPPSDGTDPPSQAVNQLTATYGTLFVIAAGNDGGQSTVASPGAASAALTVGAVDKTDVLAGFSSRGPRVGDFAIKPDITAPGVDIAAARAAGTSLGEPLDDFYTRLSGTSMATPHVAGSAALLAERHLDWTPEQLKAALVTTASPGPYTVYEQGGGRVNLTRAFTQPEVVATPAPVDFGFFPWPHDGDQAVTKTVTYTNASDEALTLDLSLAVTDGAGNPPGPGMLTVDPQSVSLAPGASQGVELTVDTSVGETTGLYGGYLVAEDAGAEAIVRTPVGFNKEGEMCLLTVEGIAHNGGPAGTISWVDVVNVEDTTVFRQNQYLGGRPVTFRLPPGTYSVMGYLFSSTEDGGMAFDVAVVCNPELQVTGDMTLMLDARQAPQVVVTADKPTEWEHFVLNTYRAGSQRGAFETLFLTGWPIQRAYAAPTQQVTLGDFGFYAKPSLRAPQLEIAIARPNAMTLDARYANGSPMVDGSKRLDLVYAGYGRVQDFEGVNVSGKAVLITRGPLPPVGDPITFAEKVANATARGAALVIIANNVPGYLIIDLGSSAQIPVLTISKAPGEELRSLLQQGKKLTVVIKGVVVSPYIYDAIITERGRIRDTHTLTLNRSNTVTVAAEYRGHVPGGWLAGEAHPAYPPWGGDSFEATRLLTTPFSRTEYVSTGDSRWWHVAWGSMNPLGDSQIDVIRTYPAPASRSDVWFAQPQRPGIVKAVELGVDNGWPVVREDNALTFDIPEFTDDQGRYGYQNQDGTDTVAFRLFENGSLIASGGGAYGSVDVSGSPATYRAELDVSRSAPYWLLSTQTHTAWTFASAPTAPGATESVPLLVVDYDLGRLDSLNRAGPGVHAVGLSVHRQQGAPAAAVTGAEVWASYDDGATWSAVPVRSLGGGRFSATIMNPVSAAGGYVSLRVRASDAGGSVVDQTIIRAYGLK